MTNTAASSRRSWHEWLESIDRRVIYIFVVVSLSIPLIFDVVLPPAPMRTAEAFYESVDSLKSEKGKLVLIASDWGPGTQAENRPQTAAAIEHLMRKRVPFGLITITPYAVPFLKNVPREVARKLEREMPGEKWEYGVDWVNFGYRPNPAIMIQGLAKATDLHQVLSVDANQTPLSDIPVMEGVHTIRDISMLMEFTGLVSAFNWWLQFFQAEGYRPPFVHGCTSITIPEAYIYFVSKQIVGLHEGGAGAAAYEVLLSKNYPNRSYGDVVRHNTSFANAQILIIIFVVIGNLGVLLSFFQRSVS